MIYEIPCQDCNKVYIGQTSKELETRIRQHKSYVNNQRSNSALFLHSFNNDHNIAWRNSKKILNCNNFHERNIIESFLIGNKINTLNISPGIFSPDPIFKSLLRVDLGHLLAWLVNPPSTCPHLFNIVFHYFSLVVSFYYFDCVFCYDWFSKSWGCVLYFFVFFPSHFILSLIL